MIRTVKKGFSLAETLVSLAIISLVLVAAMPIVKKSASSPTEAPWKYVTLGDLAQNAAVYTATGGATVAIFGDNTVPLDSNITANKAHVFASKMNPKIMIVARNRNFNPLVSRHLIDFYEKAASGDNVANIGKISFDNYYNLAVGKNALDNIDRTPIANFSNFANDTLWSNMVNFEDANLKASLNTAVGQYAMGGDGKYLAGGGGSTEYPTRNMTGGANTAVGVFAMRRNTSGDMNTAVGAYALESATDTTPGQGSHNTAIGGTALRNNNTGLKNSAMGYQALLNNTTGSYNTAIGNEALKNNTTGQNNTAIGANAAGSINESNKLYISANKDLVGTSALIYGNDTTGTRQLFFNVTNNQVYVGNNALDWGNKLVTKSELEALVAAFHSAHLPDYTDNTRIAYSDERLKDITGDNTSGLNEVLQLNVKNYTMKQDKNKEVLVGVIAQDLQKVFPNSVFEGRDGYLRIKRDEIFYACVNAIKKLHSMTQDVIAKIAGREEKIKLLNDINKVNEEKLTALEKQNKMFQERLAALENNKSKIKTENQIQTKEKIEETTKVTETK